MHTQKATTEPPARGPVRKQERAIAPDLARGLMLLLIVTSNTMFFLWAADYDTPGEHPAPGTVLDSLAQFAMVVGLDMRVYPLFAFLFGYGMVQLFLRQTSAGTSEHGAVRLLRRRSWWLCLLGLLHATLLLSTDVLGAYGLISLVLGALFLRRSDRVVRTWSTIGGVLLALGLLLGIALTLAVASGSIPAQAAPGQDSAEVSTPVLSGAGEENYLISVLYRIPMWLALTAVTTFGVTAAVAMLLGFWAARRRILEHPGEHLRLLRRTALAGLPIGWLGGLPAALAQVGAWDLGNAVTLAEPGLLAIQWSTGLAGGVGYVALFGLMAHALSERARRSVPVRAISAVGQRSLSCYLTHSLLLGPLLAAWGLGLGAHLGSATGVLYALAAWLVTAVGAYLLERAGRRGPAEVVLRRLMYRGQARS